MGPYLNYEMFTDGELTEAGRFERGAIEDTFLRVAHQAMDAHSDGRSWHLILTDPDGELPTINVGIDGAELLQ